MENIGDVRRTMFSLGLSYMMDCLGYSPQMVKLRRMVYKNEEFIHKHIQSKSFSCLDPRLVGSKSEGCSRYAESDSDHLIIVQYVVCIEASVLQYSETISKQYSVYTVVPCLYHPGHFKLLLRRKSTVVRGNLYYILNSSESGHWLSSKRFLEFVKGRIYTLTTTGFAEYNGHLSCTGPAVHFDCGCGEQDYTLTLPCICPSILSNWIQRQRKYNWPPREVIQQISQMRGNLVATGIKGCPEEELEWRLCFNEIELLLVESWNDTGMKLYKLLKMIKKDILKVEHEITSFILKNIVFWLSEGYPQSSFRPDNLFPWVIKALRLLKQAIKRYYLPYYMIPERNLMAEKLPKHRIKDVVRQINNVINMGPQLLWNCKKTEMAMTMSLPVLQLYQKKIDEYEWLWLLKNQDHKLKCGYLGLSERDWKKTDYITAIQTRMQELVFYSPWPQVIQEQLCKCSNSGEIYKWLLK